MCILRGPGVAFTQDAGDAAIAITGSLGLCRSAPVLAEKQSILHEITEKTEKWWVGWDLNPGPTA